MHVCVCAFPVRLRAKPKRFDVVGGILPGLIRSGTVFSYKLKMGDWTQKTIFALEGKENVLVASVDFPSKSLVVVYTRYQSSLCLISTDTRSKRNVPDRRCMQNTIV